MLSFRAFREDTLSRSILLSAVVIAGCGFGPVEGPHDARAPSVDAIENTRVPPPLRAPSDRPDITVYGYWPYWGDPMDTMPWDQLTHLAVFDVGLEPDGTLSNTHRWHDNAANAVSLAAVHGVKVHLCLTSFSSATMDAVLRSPTLRAQVIQQLDAMVDQYGADGVNVDFEGLGVANKADFVDFVVELQAAVDEVYLAMPAVDWAGAYDFDELSAVADGLFIMGYAYHWTGGSPGPNAPLYGGTPWSPWSLDWSVDDYRTWGATDDKLILGLPLYGFQWPTTDTSVPGSSTGTGWAVTYAAAVPAGQSHGRLYDAQTETPYAFPSASEQLWYDDAESLSAKISYAVDQGLQGVGFWAMTYADADAQLWTAIDGLTHFDGPGLQISQFHPGRAGEYNRLIVRGATPGAWITLVAGTSPGSTPVPGCPGETVDVAPPRILGGGVADANGELVRFVSVPNGVAGALVRVQAVDRSRCLVGEPSTTRF